MEMYVCNGCYTPQALVATSNTADSTIYDWVDLLRSMINL